MSVPGADSKSEALCLCTLPLDDREEDTVQLPPHSPRQLAGAQTAVHRRPVSGAH